MHPFAIDINQAHTFGREMKPREALKQKREFLSPLGWSGLTFGAAKQCRKAGTNIEQASPSGAAGGGRIKVETGDKGLSATGTDIH